MTPSYTRRQSVVGFLGSLALTAVTVLWIRAGESPIFGWFFLVFFGLAALGTGYLAVTGRQHIAFRQPEGWRIEVVPGGFDVLSTKERRIPVRWGGVRRVIAYKRDLWTTDEIRLVFESDDSEGVREISEEWPGFQDLFKEMETELGVSPGWYLDIMTPAFEPMHRVIFSRPGTAAASMPPAEPERDPAR